MHEIEEEAAALGRLAEAHKAWRDGRPAPSLECPSEKETKARIAELFRTIGNPEPQDVGVIRAAPNDPLGAAIWSQLSVIGWRLYARGGVDLLASVYRRLEVEHHPGFVNAIRRAWQGLGFSGDPRGTWLGIELL